MGCVGCMEAIEGDGIELANAGVGMQIALVPLQAPDAVLEASDFVSIAYLLRRLEYGSRFNSRW